MSRSIGFGRTTLFDLLLLLVDTMTLISSYLRHAHVACRSFYRCYSNSPMRTIDVHAIHREPNEPSIEQPFRSSNTDPVEIFSRSPIVSRRVLLAFAHGERHRIILHCWQRRLEKDQPVRESTSIAISWRSRVKRFPSLLVMNECRLSLVWSIQWNCSDDPTTFSGCDQANETDRLEFTTVESDSLWVMHLVHRWNDHRVLWGSSVWTRRRNEYVSLPCTTLWFSEENAVGQHTDGYADWVLRRRSSTVPCVSSASEVLKLALDATPSPNNELMWDTPAAATAWLKTFAINNEALLKETNVQNRSSSSTENPFLLCV